MLRDAHYFEWRKETPAKQQATITIHEKNQENAAIYLRAKPEKHLN